MVNKAWRSRHQVSEELEPPPGLPAPTKLAPPPGLPAPSTSRKKASKKRHADAGLDLAAAGCPPGLSLPPGLETINEDVANSESTASGESPVYLDSSADASQASEEMHQVQLTGLPNQILSDMMMEAVLQQAQLNGCYTSFTTSPGKSCGEVVINMVSAEAAEWCAQHFHGRSWSADGTVVSACLLNQNTTEAEISDVPERAWLEAWFQEACAMEGYGKLDEEIFQPVDAMLEMPASGFPVDAPAFLPTPMTFGGFSAEAPVFVPGQKSMEKFSNNSECSTVDGESESDEDKAAAEVAA